MSSSSEGKRTPFCEWSGGKRGDGESGGLLSDVSAEELGTIVIEGALASTGTDPSSVDHVVMGHALQTSGQAIFGARHAGLRAGIPPGSTHVDTEPPVRQWSPIRSHCRPDDYAGGSEYCSGWRHGESEPGAHGSQGYPPCKSSRKTTDPGQILDKDMEDYLFTNLLDSISNRFMAQTSDELCKRLQVTREQADSFAALSHQRTETSISNGLWNQEIVEVHTPDGAMRPIRRRSRRTWNDSGILVKTTYAFRARISCNSWKCIWNRRWSGGRRGKVRGSGIVRWGRTPCKNRIMGDCWARAGNNGLRPSPI